MGELVAALATLATLAYLAVQVRQNTRALRAATLQQISEAMASNVGSIVENGELSQIMVEAGRDGELSPAELLRYRGLMLMSMRRLESVYHQHQLGSITKEQMQGFELSMISLVRMPLARQWWEEARPTFHEGFASAVDARLAKDDLLVRHPSIAGD